MSFVGVLYSVQRVALEILHEMISFRFMSIAQPRKADDCKPSLKASDWMRAPCYPLSGTASGMTGPLIALIQIIVVRDGIFVFHQRLDVSPQIR